MRVDLCGTQDEINAGLVTAGLPSNVTDAARALASSVLYPRGQLTVLTDAEWVTMAVNRIEDDAPPSDITNDGDG